MAFEGPLFIVGLSRSGTSLLRNLLNRNSRISMTPVESHFIPFLISKYGRKPDFSTLQKKEQLKKCLRKTFFFRKLASKGYSMNWPELMRRMETGDWNLIIQYIFETFAEKPYQPGMIWGDKTPRYLPYVPNIKEILPNARFIQIIRDPRDRAMSVKARWGKVFSRSASEWNRQLTLSREYPNLLGADYKEIHYEKLLADPEETMMDLCKFMEVNFEPEMLTQKKAERRYGDTRGKLHIVSENCNKFANRLSDRKIRRIEEIAFPMMQELGYEVMIAAGHIPVGRVRALILRMFDIVFHVWSILREYGFRAGIQRSYQVFRTRILLKYISKRGIGPE